MNFKVSKKINDKWVSVGNIKQNQYGNPALGLHCTPQLKQLIADTPDGKWINFALFENKDKAGADHA